MKRFLMLLAVAVFITGCTTMPGPVDERYLVEKNQNESAAINSIEQKIIEKNREKKAIELKLKGISSSPAVTNDELKLLKKENGLLKDQVDFYTKTRDAVNLESRNAQLKENETAIEKKTAEFNYQTSEKEMTEAELEVKTNELSVLIAQLNYEKSKIATAYRDKYEEAPAPDSGSFFTKTLNRFRKKDPADKYGYKKYEEYLKKQQDELLKSEKKLKEAEKKFQEAKLKIQTSDK